MKKATRRDFVKKATTAALGATLSPFALLGSEEDTPVKNKPNVILCMADDLGWGDPGYNGNPVAKTPHLDQMAADGLRFDRFYAAAPVCSPTRASCLTGRNPYRSGVFHANRGILRPEEFTLMEFLKEEGYTTGHFGKWHLGTLTHQEKDSNRGKPGNEKYYNPPWLQGFDVCFSTEAKVPTYDPMLRPKDPKLAPWPGWPALKKGEERVAYGTYYWDEKGQKATDNLEGDDSRVIMDRAIPFIEKAAKDEQPFLAVIWFHTPHVPCVAGEKHLKPYKKLSAQKARYYGAVTAMDEQMGRLRKQLKELGVEDNTMLFFCSDNGAGTNPGQDSGSNAPFKGGKLRLFEGGIRVPSIVVWPDKVKKGRHSSEPVVTSDYLPTVMDALGAKWQDRKLDGTSILPLIEGDKFKREKNIGFIMRHCTALQKREYKLYTNQWGENVELYDIVNDSGEKENIAEEKPELVQELLAQYMSWESDVKNSFEGKEYGRESFDKLKQKWPGNKKKK